MGSSPRVGGMAQYGARVIFISNEENRALSRDLRRQTFRWRIRGEHCLEDFVFPREIHRPLRRDCWTVDGTRRRRRSARSVSVEIARRSFQRAKRSDLVVPSNTGRTFLQLMTVPTRAARQDAGSNSRRSETLCPREQAYLFRARSVLAKNHTTCFARDAKGRAQEQAAAPFLIRRKCGRAGGARNTNGLFRSRTNAGIRTFLSVFETPDPQSHHRNQKRYGTSAPMEA